MREELSKLSDHKFKKGVIVSPFNEAFEKTMQLSSWTSERLPEYLWLGLILNHYGREKGLKVCENILRQMANINENIVQPKLSSIFNMNKEKQKDIYTVISNYIDPYVLSPLTVLYRGDQYGLFNEYFYDSNQTIENRIIFLQNSIETFYDPQSNEATDLRYLSICLPLFKGKIHFSEDVSIIIEALSNYSNVSHDDKRMRMYRPSIRSFEIVEFVKKNNDFISYFWNEIGLCTECMLMYIDNSQNINFIQEFFDDTKKMFENLIVLNKENLFDDSKFNVLMGSTCYILKLVGEVLSKDIKNDILGRLALRTILEVFIMTKYLTSKESIKNNIFESYKIYGVGKYKHILLRLRESDLGSESHISLPMLEAIVNENMWEEFLDIDIRFFDQQNIKKKFEEVNEKELYEIFYEYTTNYAHGFWGAIRESSQLICNNPLHKFHTVSDYKFNQKLPSVLFDIDTILKKHIALLSEIYDFPNWYKIKYKDLIHG